MLLPLLLLVAIAGLLVNTFWLRSDLAKSTQLSLSKDRKIAILHVHLMDRVLKEQEGRDLDKLLDSPKEWLAPFQARINEDPKLAALLREVGLNPTRKDGMETVEIYCNPIDDIHEPYEVFKLHFIQDRCVEISRVALRPW